MKILDCTLRDGGYYTNWDFDDALVTTYINAMNQLPIDYIELGYCYMYHQMAILVNLVILLYLFSSR